MVRLLTVLFLTLLTFSSLNAQPYEIIFSERQSGAENYACFDPLLDQSNQFAGLIYCDTVRHQVVVDDFRADSTITIGIDGTPLKVIHSFTREHDRLLIYVLISVEHQMPQIGLFTVSSEGISQTMITTDCFAGAGNLSGLQHLDLQLYRSNNSAVNGIWFEAGLLFEDFAHSTSGSLELVSTSILYSPDLQNELLRNNVTAMRAGNLSGDDDDEFAVYKNYSYQYSYGGSSREPIEGEVHWTSYGVQDAGSRIIASQASDNGHTFDMFVGDFEPGAPYDEIIYFGDAFDLANGHADRIPHVACYSLADEAPRELWYREIDDIMFDYVYSDKSVLVGRQGADKIVFLDYQRGEIVETVNLDRELSSVAFFETYENPRTLNLVGRSADSVFVYRFDISVALEVSTNSSGQEVIPLSFSLYQNHPNPFNGETRFAFDTEESQYLSLKVYNILGQEVATLAEGVFGPGIYYAYWSGKDDRGISQSSGVYFAKLQGGADSQIIKLIYVK